MNGSVARLGLGLATSSPVQFSASRSSRAFQHYLHQHGSSRHISSIILQTTSNARSKLLRTSLLTKTQPPPPPTTNPPPSFFTPSLCRFRRNASTTASPPPPSAVRSSTPTSASILDWNAFFNLRTSRRRYSLASSVITSMASTTGMIALLSSNPELQDWINKTLNLDLFVSLGLTTFAALLLGWLVGPVFGNALWRLLHRSRMPEFTVKERAFFERIKKHRVNPSGASTNNPVPDFYGEKVGSVQGYRRWLKDQRAFNRKRGGAYSATV